MAITGTLCVTGALEIAKGNIAWLASGGTSVYAALFTDACTLDSETSTTYASLSGESSGDGYTAGGKALTLLDVAYDDINQVIKLDASDLSWANSTITARYCVIYAYATGKIIGWVDFGGNVSSTSQEFKIAWPSTGVFKYEPTIPA